MTAYTQARFTVPPPKVSEAEWDRIFKPKPKPMPKKKKRGCK